MLTGPEKLRKAVQSAGDSVREAAEGTGKLVIAALITAGAALLVALAALVAALRGRPSLAS